MRKKLTPSEIAAYREMARAAAKLRRAQRLAARRQRRELAGKAVPCAR